MKVLLYMCQNMSGKTLQKRGPVTLTLTPDDFFGMNIQDSGSIQVTVQRHTQGISPLGVYIAKNETNYQLEKAMIVSHHAPC